MQRRELLTGIVGLALGAQARAADAPGSLGQRLMRAGGTLRQVLAEAHVFEPQILYTPLIRDAQGDFQPGVTESFGLTPKRWFAAASFVKLPLAALLLEALEARGLLQELPRLQLRVDSAHACAPLPDAMAGGLPLLRLLRAMLIVSDNRAYNALYELLGSDAIHNRLRELDYPHIRVSSRLGCAGLRPGKLAASLSVGAAARWQSPAQPDEQPQAFPFASALKGRAWMENGKLIPGPRDFSTSNFMPLADVHRLMLELGSGQPPKTGPGFALSGTSRRLLADTLATLPRDCPDPAYAETDFPDDHGKWLLPLDSAHRLAPRWHVASKNAQSFGYIGDSAIVHDRVRQRAAAITAMLYVDRDGVLNDGRYAYEEIGRPFLRELGPALLS